MEGQEDRDRRTDAGKVLRVKSKPKASSCAERVHQHIDFWVIHTTTVLAHFSSRVHRAKDVYMKNKLNKKNSRPSRETFDIL